MGKFDGWMIASDMDGTLLNDERCIGEKTIEALRYFTENGGKFALATGRTRPATAAYRSQLPCNAPGVYLNGAIICDESTQQIVFMEGLDARAIDIARAVMEKFPYAGIEVFLLDHSYVCRMNETSREHFALLDIPYIETPLENVPEPPEQWGKINFTGTHEQMELVRAFLQPQEQLFNLTFSTPVFYEMTCKGGHKGDGVRRAAQYAGIAPDHICAIGDSQNDLPMLQTAGISFAPANARDNVLATVDVVVQDNNQDALAGVVSYLETKCGAAGEEGDA